MLPQFITLQKNAKDITGQRFGRLVALGPVSRHKGHIKWLCQCDCGNIKEVDPSHLRRSLTVSCGCYHSERTTTLNTTHGMKNTLLYDVWCGIVQRCTNPNSKRYADWGGRGIAICEEWRHDFQSFFDHVSQLEHYGDKGRSLDRVDNNGNYEPGNLKWSTQSEQTRNTRANRLLTFSGKTQCIAAWEDELGLRKGQISNRLYRGWSVERALSVER